MLPYHSVLDISSTSYSIIHTPGVSAQHLPFYIHSYGHFQAYSGYVTEREDLDNYLLIYTVSGSGILKYRGSEFCLMPGQAFVIHCLEYQRYQTGEGGAWEIKWLHFNGSASAGYERLINSGRLNVVRLVDQAAFEKMMDRIPPLLGRNDFKGDAELVLVLTRIVTELIGGGVEADGSQSTRYQENCERLIAYFQTHYSENLKIGDLLRTVPFSPYHFIRLFKRHTGFSPYEYLTNYRINCSKRLLKETRLSVKEIAYRVGFNDINNYIREFKKLAGTTPVKYRKLWIG